MKFLLRLLSLTILLTPTLVGQQNPPVAGPSTVGKLRDDLDVLRGDGGNTTMLLDEFGWNAQGLQLKIHSME